MFENVRAFTALVVREVDATLRLLAVCEGAQSSAVLTPLPATILYSHSWAQNIKVASMAIAVILTCLMSLQLANGLDYGNELGFPHFIIQRNTT